METKLCMNDVVLSSASEIFETMMFMSIRGCDDSECEIEGNELIGSITFKGDKLEGALFIKAIEQSCGKIAAAMLGLDSPDEVGKTEISDALGEICNMVMGSVKARIIAEFGDFHVSIPSVVSGKLLETSINEKCDKTVIKAMVDEEFGIEFTIFYRLV